MVEYNHRKISIHALREEGDAGSTPVTSSKNISIHALREEGDFANLGEQAILKKISIHALREEGDWTISGVSARYEKFLSTPSARRATCTHPVFDVAIVFLSTPSARRATIEIGLLSGLTLDFYPRPPRGGRLWSPPLAFNAI